MSITNKIKPYPSQAMDLDDFTKSQWFISLDEELRNLWLTYPPNELYYCPKDNGYVSCVITNIKLEREYDDFHGEKLNPIVTVFARGTNPPDSYGEFDIPIWELKTELTEDEVLLDAIDEEESEI